jgi:hypothetical protein
MMMSTEEGRQDCGAALALVPTHGPCVETSLDAARTSACATKEVGGIGPMKCIAVLGQ